MLAEISELAFRQHFEKCGTVEAVRLVRDKNSGLGKGFGYVLFEVGMTDHLLSSSACAIKEL